MSAILDQVGPEERLAITDPLRGDAADAVEVMRAPGCGASVRPTEPRSRRDSGGTAWPGE